MKCKWCNGTGEECGCGQGYCDHCNKGQTADWPFGLTEKSLTEDCHDLFDKVWRWNSDIRIVIGFVAEIKKVTFSDNDIEMLAAFYHHPHRDTNIGTFCAIVVARAHQIAAETAK